MLGWLYSILVGNLCQHKWEIHSEVPCDIVDDDLPSIVIGRFTRYDLKCSKCGTMKFVNNQG